MSGASTAEGTAHPVAAAAAAPALVVGLGNPILGDDGVGWRVVDVVEPGVAADATVALDRLAVGGLTLMERLVGARRALLVDAVSGGHDPVGTVRRRDLGSAPVREAGHLDAAHDVTLAAALDVGRALGAELPSEIALVTVEIEPVTEFGETMTPAVAAAVPVAAELVRAWLGGR
jgi:hydrogenase maturation protease